MGGNVSKEVERFQSRVDELEDQVKDAQKRQGKQVEVVQDFVSKALEGLEKDYYEYAAVIGSFAGEMGELQVQIEEVLKKQKDDFISRSEVNADSISCFLDRSSSSFDSGTPISIDQDGPFDDGSLYRETQSILDDPEIRSITDWKRMQLESGLVTNRRDSLQLKYRQKMAVEVLRAIDIVPKPFDDDTHQDIKRYFSAVRQTAGVNSTLVRAATF